ncbi:mechanosensitive ion channel family protein [Candidatus Methylomirabilis sp.]|uniref:mechanosensitive ion channel family protein n=1 Tax=Candidatus Methylomirabilis sp. TaxID=2032687 RepID=UPI002A5C220D|nr:mechanosensitive ion channel family protein [Candidatus Methylomirabilis sp.]
MIGKQIIVELLVAAAVGLLSSAWLLWLRRIGLRALTRLARTTESRLDDLALSAFRLPSLLWCLVLGVYIGLSAAPTMPTRIGQLVNDVLVIVLILSVTIAVGRFFAASIVSYADRLGLAIAVTGLTTALVRGVVYLCGALVLLNTLGISITPILTALGVGGLAVALALQGSLANLFAGIHILVEKPIRVGDYIKLESGQEGYVVDIGWRTTRVRMLPNNMVIVPNAKLAESIVINYHLPEKRMSVLIPIGVGYQSDPARIEAILMEEVASAMDHVPGLLAEPAPFVRFIPGFGESSLDFTLIVQINEVADQYLVQHELRKRIFARFQKEGIEIPFPQRVVHVHAASVEVPPAC